MPKRLSPLKWLDNFLYIPEVLYVLFFFMADLLRSRKVQCRLLARRQITGWLRWNRASGGSAARCNPGWGTPSCNANHTLDFDEVRMPRLLSVNVGLPSDVTWNGKTVRTSVWKSAVDGRRMVRRLNIDGDAQADLTGHGGEHRAVFVYQMDSYHYWERFLGRSDFSFGQFRRKLHCRGTG